MIYFDATCACLTVQNTGMPRMTRRIFAELKQRAEVRPIFWNDTGRCYQELGEAELSLLERPFQGRSRATARPEWYGGNPLVGFLRLITRPRFDLEKEIDSGDIFLVPDSYRNRRQEVLPDFVKQTHARTVAIFHDAADLRLPAIYVDRGEKFRHYIESLSLFDLVICISDEAREDLHRLWENYGCRAPETCVEMWPGETGTAGDRPGSGLGNGVLYVSSFTPRKNHLTLLRAAEKLWRQGLSFELHLIGRSAGPPLNKVVPQIWKLRLRGRPVRWHRHVNEETLVRAYQDCQFTVYPSLMEGFGLPIMESLLHGKPCVCGGNGALGEIARGGGCLIVDQTSVYALANGMKKLLCDEATYQRLRDEARARQFRSWPDYVDHLLRHLDVRPRSAPGGLLSSPRI
jgi:glycosyltransferase involved in cell wall biosynthesis